jgi:hypothetical protein
MNSFSLIISPGRQSPSVQHWLELHTWEHDPQNGVEAMPYHSGDSGDILYKVQFTHPKISVRSVSPHLIPGILINRFNWPERFATPFLSEHGQLLEIWLGDTTCIYYARPLDLDISELRIDSALQ